MTAALAHTALHGWHVAHGGRMVDFAGWSMPVQYTSITEEHQATRQRASLFDVSHMGRLLLEGRDATGFLESLLTRRVADQPCGRIRYSLVTQDQGGILDDVLVYHLRSTQRPSFFWMVVNASNRQKILDWLTAHQSSGMDLRIHDETQATAMIAVQGPRALSIVERVVGSQPLRSLKYYRAAWIEDGTDLLLMSRTGYTGEDGVELVARQEFAVDLWQQLMNAGESEGILPAGLGARDTLRLEAAMPLYGHELSEEITPIQAGLEFAVDLDNRSFPGIAALRSAQSDPQLPRRIGLRLTGKRVPRQHYRVRSDQGAEVGEVTSGTFSPTFACPLAMAYVQPEHGQPGNSLQIDVRGQLEPATVVALPFYQRP